MKIKLPSFNSKELLVLELLLLVFIGLFSLDFLPSNYNNFQSVCAQTWPKDPKQYEICMQPYFREVNLDKYAIGATAAAFLILPIFYFFKKK